MSNPIPVTKIWERHWALFEKYHPLNPHTDFAKHLKEESEIFNDIYDLETKTWRASYDDCEPVAHTISWLYVMLNDWPKAIEFYERLETHPDHAEYDQKVIFHEHKYKLMLLKILMGQTYLQEEYLSALKQQGIARWAAPGAIQLLCEIQSGDDPVPPEIKEFTKQIFLTKRGFKRPAYQATQVKTFAELARIAESAGRRSTPADKP